jgi:hypothetical protein
MAPTRPNHVRAAKRRDEIKASVATGISQTRERPFEIRDVKFVT